MNILEIIIVAVISTLGGIITGISVRKDKKKSINQVHFYVARDPDGSLWLYVGKPFRKRDRFSTRIPDSWTRLNSKDEFDYFGLNKKDYANLKWEDEPVEVFINMED